jgi:hypothetical protein
VIRITITPHHDRELTVILEADPPIPTLPNGEFDYANLTLEQRRGIHAARIAKGAGRAYMARRIAASE